MYPYFHLAPRPRCLNTTRRHLPCRLSFSTRLIKAFVIQKAANNHSRILPMTHHLSDDLLGASLLTSSCRTHHAYRRWKPSNQKPYQRIHSGYLDTERLHRRHLAMSSLRGRAPLAKEKRVFVGEARELLITRVVRRVNQSLCHFLLVLWSSRGHSPPQPYTSIHSTPRVAGLTKGLSKGLV